MVIWYLKHELLRTRSHISNCCGLAGMKNINACRNFTFSKPRLKKHLKINIEMDKLDMVKLEQNKKEIRTRQSFVRYCLLESWKFVGSLQRLGRWSQINEIIGKTIRKEERKDEEAKIENIWERNTNMKFFRLITKQVWNYRYWGENHLETHKTGEWKKLYIRSPKNIKKLFPTKI